MKLFESISQLLSALKVRAEHASYRVRGRKCNFEKIYKEGGFSGREYPASGVGSTLEQTRRIRESIPAIIKALEAKVLLDAPCGDFTWMQEMNLGNTYYIGADIVEEVIKKNTLSHFRKNRSFVVADIVQDSLPKADIVLCRDCFVHLSNKDIVRAIRNFKKSQSTYLLTTNFYSIQKNIDLVSGRGWRPINLKIPPFNFPSPLQVIIEECTELNGEYKDKSLGLWKLADIALELH